MDQILSKKERNVDHTKEKSKVINENYNNVEQ